MKTIVLLPLQHKGFSQILFKFGFDRKIYQHIKDMPGREWNSSNRCWSIKYKPNAIKNLENYFAGIAKIDSSRFSEVTVSKPSTKGHFDHQMSPAIKQKVEQFEKWLLQRRYSKRSVDTYATLIKRFLIYHKGKNLHHITIRDIHIFNHDFIMKNNYSIAYQRQMTSSLKLFFSQIENMNINPDDLQHPRKEKKLPTVFSKREIKAILTSFRNVKHKTAIAILYGAGLRISELLNIKLEDIDPDRHRIHIRGAKGNKDRYVNLSDRMIKMLNAYIQSYHPKEYLFNGQFSERYSASSCRQVLKRAMKLAGINKSAGLHTLRHSYATHLHENGTDIHHIQVLLGHKSVKTTEIYTHISKHKLGEIRSPLDDL